MSLNSRKLFRNDVTTLILRLAVVYVVMFIMQMAFYFIDRPYLGHIADWHEASQIIIGSLKYNTLSILWTNALFIFLSILPFHFREKKWYQTLLFIIYWVTNSFAIIVLNGGDVVYYPHAMKRFTTEELHFFNENSNSSPIIMDFIMQNLTVLIIGLLLMALLAFCWYYIKYFPTEIEDKKRYYRVNAITFCCVAAICAMGMRGTCNPKQSWKPLSEAADYSPERVWVILSNPYCAIRTTVGDLYDKDTYFDKDELDEIYTPEHQIDSSRCNLGHRNIMLFILESFSKEHSKFLNPELYKDEAGFTPFLDSLMQQGYTFTHAYSNGMKSVEAIPSVFASIPSFRTSFALMPEHFGEFEALPEILANQGYATSFFSGAERNSMNFERISEMFGVQKCYCRDEYEASYPVNENTIEPFWGVFDMPYFQFMADEIGEMQQPFFASVFNLTSHHPYRVPTDYADSVPSGYNPEQRVVAYTDLSIRKFFDRVDEEPWFDSTLFIFVADHVAPLAYDSQTLTMQGRSSIIGFMFTPDGSLKGINDATVQQLDIMPTVLGLIGYDKPYFAFGRDVFNEPERKPVAVNCINQVYQCITDSATVYFDNKKTVKSIGGNPQETAEAETIIKAVIQSYGERLTAKDYRVKSSNSE